MVNEDVLFALMLLVAGALCCCAAMLAGIRDLLCNIDYDLSLRNMREFCEGRREYVTIENDD